MILQFVLKQENNDATCNYNIPLPDNTTVNDFIDAVLAYNLITKQRDQGVITILPHTDICTYDGSMAEFNNSFLDYKDHFIKHVWCNGGWGLMDYYLTI